MDALTKSKIQMFGAWCAITYLVILYIGWAFIAGFIPPVSPMMDAESIAILFQDNILGIRIGMILVMFAALVFIPFAAVMSQFIAEIEGSPGVLTYSFLLGAVGNMVLTFYPAIWWLVAAYRPERTAELTLLLNDAAWLQFLGGVSMYLAMPLIIMVVSLCDKSQNPAFPKWVGYANFWMAVTILPDQLMFFFYDGPFAWNGLFGIWIPLVVFSGFFVVNFYALRQKILIDRKSL